ncbi:MAG: hypothetical protein KDD58_08820 [Bdellovibrionales bacterium]|nr:hypothetical protein [Bdellovibrionales bacterium]
MQKIIDFSFSKLLISLVVLLIHLNANFAKAQLFTGPVSSGVGGAGVASAEVVESTFLNPASLAHAPTFVGGVFYQDGWLDGVNHNTDLAVNLVDNSDGVIFPGALGFVQRRMNYYGEKAVDKRLWHLSLGNFVVPKFSAGLSFHYMEADREGESFDRFNMTAGFLWNPHPDWGFGLVYYNLIEPDDKIPLYFRDLSKVSLGALFVASRFLRVRMDISSQVQFNTNNDLQLKGGLESYLNRFFILRVGWRTDSLIKQDTLTAGFSFVGPKFTIDYAYQKSQEEAEKGALHSVDMSVPF